MTFRLSLLSVCVILAGAQLTSAQTLDASRPYEGLFRAQTAVPPLRALALRSTSELSVSLFHVMETASGATTVAPASYTALDSSLTRRGPARRYSYDLSLSSQVRHYGTSSAWVAGREAGTLDLNARLNRHTTVTLSNHFSYSPTYTVGVPLAIRDGISDDALSSSAELIDSRPVSGSSTLTLARQLGRRTAVEVDYGVGGVLFLSSDTLVGRQRASALLRHAVTEQRSLQIRYDYTQVNTRLQYGWLVVSTHQADAGMEWRLPGNTRLLVGVTPGMATQAGAPGSARTSTAVSARVGARVGIERRLMHSWRVGGGYQRAVYADEGYGQPIFAATRTASVEGRPSRRLTVSASAAYSTGHVHVEGSPMTALGYSTRTTLEASRRTAFEIEYQRAISSGGRELANMPSGERQRDQQRIRVALVVAL